MYLEKAVVDPIEVGPAFIVLEVLPNPFYSTIAKYWCSGDFIHEHAHALSST